MGSFFYPERSRKRTCPHYSEAETKTISKFRIWCLTFLLSCAATIDSTVFGQGTPIDISWENPAAIEYGTPLDAPQLNAVLVDVNGDEVPGAKDIVHQDQASSVPKLAQDFHAAAMMDEVTALGAVPTTVSSTDGFLMLLSGHVAPNLETGCKITDSQTILYKFEKNTRVVTGLQESGPEGLVSGETAVVTELGGFKSTVN